MHALNLILMGLGLGIGAAVPIGPVNVEIARRTLARGRWAGMALGFGAVSVDMVFGAASFLGFDRVMRGTKFEHTFGYAGVGLCLVLAAISFYAAYRAYRHGVDEPTPGDDAAHTRGLAKDFGTGVLMTGLNIYTWLWWFGAVPNLLAQRGGGGHGEWPFTFAGIFTAAAAWVVVFTTIIHAVRHFAGRKWHIGADLAGGGILLVFALIALWRLVERPL